MIKIKAEHLVTNRMVWCGAPGEIRTPDLLVRSQALYPTELRALRYEKARIISEIYKIKHTDKCLQAHQVPSLIFRPGVAD